MDGGTALVQWTGIEPDSGSSPLPLPKQPQVRRDPGPGSSIFSVVHLAVHEADLIGVHEMDYDTAGCEHGGKERRKEHCVRERKAERCKSSSLVMPLTPTQRGGNQLRESRGSTGTEDAAKLVLVEHYTGIREGRRATELLGLRPGLHLPKCSYYWKRSLLLGTCEEYVGVPCLRYGFQIFDGESLCLEHWPRRPTSQLQSRADVAISMWTPAPCYEESSEHSARNIL